MNIPVPCVKYQAKTVFESSWGRRKRKKSSASWRNDGICYVSAFSMSRCLSSKHVSCICFTIHRLCVTVSEDMYLHKLSFEQLSCSCFSKSILDVEWPWCFLMTPWWFLGFENTHHEVRFSKMDSWLDSQTCFVPPSLLLAIVPIQHTCFFGLRRALKTNIWVFPKIVVPQNGWFIKEIPIKMDDLGVPLFSETPISRWHVF